MNKLVDRFGTEHVAVLGFPCNQFGHQENATEQEIPLMLRHVRPGNNFEPKIELFGKIDVNGEKTHPLYKFLKERLPHPSDDPSSLMNDIHYIVWSPVTRSDISWNFEKFLVSPVGEPIRRYSCKYQTIKLEMDIQFLIDRHIGCSI